MSGEEEKVSGLTYVSATLGCHDPLARIEPDASVAGMLCQRLAQPCEGVRGRVGIESLQDASHIAKSSNPLDGSLDARTVVYGFRARR